MEELLLVALLLLRVADPELEEEEERTALLEPELERVELLEAELLERVELPEAELLDSLREELEHWGQ